MATIIVSNVYIFVWLIDIKTQDEFFVQPVFSLLSGTCW